jgi:hypothetical protein
MEKRVLNREMSLPVTRCCKSRFTEYIGTARSLCSGTTGRSPAHEGSGIGGVSRRRVSGRPTQQQSAVAFLFLREVQIFGLRAEVRRTAVSSGAQEPARQFAEVCGNSEDREDRELASGCPPALSRRKSKLRAAGRFSRPAKINQTSRSSRLTRPSSFRSKVSLAALLAIFATSASTSVQFSWLSPQLFAKRIRNNEARSAAVYLNRMWTSVSATELAARYGGVSQAAISKTVQRAEMQRGKDRRWNHELARLDKSLRSKE